MKARVKATGKIIDVEDCGSVFRHGALLHGYKDANGIKYLSNELELPMDFNFWEACQDETPDSPDYWTRLEHQYAGMAMQGLCANYTEFTKDNDGTLSNTEMIAENARLIAHALVEKYKKEE